MKTKLDEVYSELKGRMKCNVLVFSDDPQKNMLLLDQNIQTINIAKCGLEEIEREYPGASIYLAYLLQTEKNIPFNLCKDFKLWYNLSGLQTRCKKRKDLIQINCNGSLKQCSISKKI